MNNPFIFGEVVRGAEFTDREKETRELIQELSERTRIFLVSPRRYGKTSLILRVLEQLQQSGYLTTYIDFYQVTSLEQFMTLYAHALAQSTESRIEQVLHTIQEMLASLRPQVSINPQGELQATLETRKPQDLFLGLNHLLDASEKLAVKKKKRWIVVMDEFQEIRTFGGTELEKHFRSRFQHHAHVSYLFAGSKQHILMDMVQNKSRAFYKMGKIIFLDKIPESEFIPFIQKGFNQGGILISPDAITFILKITENIPHYVQHLCHELWNIYFSAQKKSIDISGIQNTIAQIAQSQSPLYITFWDTLSRHKRQTLQALAAEETHSPFSHAFAEKYRLGALASVQSSIRLLVQKDILQKKNGHYHFTDIWFKEWVRQLSLPKTFFAN